MTDTTADTAKSISPEKALSKARIRAYVALSYLMCGALFVFVLIIRMINYRETGVFNSDALSVYGLISQIFVVITAPFGFMSALFNYFQTLAEQKQTP